jgi:death on curing protein
MDGISQLPSIADIIEINRQMIREFGGIYFEADRNLRNPGPLEHVLEAVQGSLFGKELYPSLSEKAAAICWRIITAHVFHDGNKRTGIESCHLLLEINGINMRIDRSAV